MEIDLEKISLEKIQKNDEKYPVEKSRESLKNIINYESPSPSSIKC